MNVLSYNCPFCQKLFSEKIMLSTTLKSAQRQWMKMTLIMMKIEIFAVPTVTRNSTLKTMFSYIWTLTNKLFQYNLLNIQSIYYNTYCQNALQGLAYRSLCNYLVSFVSFAKRSLIWQAGQSVSQW